MGTPPGQISHHLGGAGLIVCAFSTSWDSVAIARAEYSETDNAKISTKNMLLTYLIISPVR